VPISALTKDKTVTLDTRGLPRLPTIALVILASCAVLALLVYGKTFLIPLVIALLVTTLLSSAIVRLEAFGFPAWLATICAIGALLVVLFFVGTVLFDQAAAISAVWPRYVTRFNAILADLTAWAGQDVSAGMAKLMTRIDLAGLVSRFAGSAGSFFATIVLIMLYSAFLLAERGGLPSKFGYLVPDPKRNADLQAILGAVSRGIRQYLSVKTLMSLITGGLCYVILKAYAVDFAEFWGLLIFFLNFIPNIGSAIAVIIPSLLALVQFDTVWTPLTILVLMIGVQFVIGNIVEPKYMGRTLNLSSFVVIVSLTFWGTIWGIQGMFLSVPMTASFVIICRSIPELRWIAILLSVDGRLEADDVRNDKPIAGSAE
jgi:AI-2 transport protein TqsA